jgi:hypothetical protein
MFRSKQQPSTQEPSRTEHEPETLGRLHQRLHKTKQHHGFERPVEDSKRGTLL